MLIYLNSDVLFKCVVICRPSRNKKMMCSLLCYVCLTESLDRHILEDTRKFDAMLSFTDTHFKLCQCSSAKPTETLMLCKIENGPSIQMTKTNGLTSIL